MKERVKTGEKKMNVEEINFEMRKEISGMDNGAVTATRLIMYMMDEVL